MKSVTVWSWNANSLIANGNKFLHSLNNMNIMPDVICYQESKLKFNKIFHIKNYKVYRKDGPDNQLTGGGVVTFIKSNIRHTVTPILSDIEAMKITLHLVCQDIDIINIYNPPQKIIDVHKYNQLIKNSNLLLIGDLNAHNTFWHSNNTNANGR